MLKKAVFRIRKFLFQGVVFFAFITRRWTNFTGNHERMNIRLERQRRALKTTVDFVEAYMASVDSAKSPKELLARAFKLADVSGDRLICEFGVFMGESINHIAKMTDREIFGFDSFAGLPEKWLDGWKVGDFAVPMLPKVRSNVHLIKGWFNETLPGFVKEHPGEVGFLHVDSDLYSSAKTIFEYLESRLKPGAVILFDEYFNYPGWEQGEHKAFTEFLARTGYSVEYIGYVRDSHQLAVILREKK
jgi:hypothetical protein